MEDKGIKEQIVEALKHKKWDVSLSHNTDEILVNLGDRKPVEISIPKIQQRIKNEKKSATQVIDDVVEQIQIMMNSIHSRNKLSLVGQDNLIFPVMRSTSFPTETADGKKLIFDDHTAESRIFYAVDLGQSYTLIDEKLLEESTWTKQVLKEKALFNLRGLHNDAKEDIVAGNYFYFISTTDGYGASRILNQALIQSYQQKVKGDFCLAIPHQDVLVLADLRNETGYDVLGQLSFHFYTGGAMPITALPFDFKDGKLEPIFILAKRKPRS